MKRLHDWLCRHGMHFPTESWLDVHPWKPRPGEWAWPWTAEQVEQAKGDQVLGMLMTETTRRTQCFHCGHYWDKP
jgi:hypothetical protein